MTEIISHAEAVLRGLKRYFTGEPCAAGHVADRRTHNGECCECARMAAARRYALKRNDEAFRTANAARALANYRQRMAPRRLAKETRAEAARRDFPDIAFRTRDEALAAGISRYFVGARCAQGHIAERQTSDRSCIVCKRLGVKKWRATHGEALIAYYAAYYAKNVEEQKEKARRHHAARADDPAFRANNSAKTRAWIKANPDKHKRNLHRRRARELTAEGEFAAEDLARIRQAQKDRYAYCRTKLRGKGELDHILPLVPRDGAELGTNRPSNLQFLCRRCNRRKHTKDPADFAREIGLLL